VQAAGLAQAAAAHGTDQFKKRIFAEIAQSGGTFLLG
jgi:hypothetical protein